MIMQYVKKIYGAVCGPHNSKLLYYRNAHPSITIKITVDHHWFYDGKERHETQYYTLLPNPNQPFEPNEKDVLMGCPIPGPTLQTFHWDLKAAEPV